MAFKGVDTTPRRVTAATLDDLWEAYRSDRKFDHLRLPGIRLVAGEGSLRPVAFVVGEAPGAQENTEGRPFVGASGQVLRQLMAMAYLSQENSWITNTVKYRPPNNRTPVYREILDSQPYLLREWELLQRPRVIVAVGGVAAQALLPGEFGPMYTRVGQPRLARDGRTWVYTQYHPAFGLRGGDDRKEQLERHWERMGEWLSDERLLP
jgi:uracil-DNA glycosylase